MCYLQIANNVINDKGNWLCYLQITKDHESLFINRKSNFMQFANRIPLSLKFINRYLRSKVKCVIYKSQIRKSVERVQNHY